MTILSLVLMVLLAASVALNVYLGWELAGLEVAVSRRGPQPIENAVPVPTSVLAAIPTQTPEPPPSPTSTPTPIPTQALIDSQVATIAAIATQVAAARFVNTPIAGVPVVPPATPVAPAVAVPTAVAIGTPAVEANAPQPAAIDSSSSAGIGTEAGQAQAPAATPASTAVAAASLAQEFVPQKTSSNNYSLIPIEGDRESRPPAEHGDLNLKLREPEPSGLDTSLVEIPGSGIDPEGAPDFSAVFNPDEIIGTFAIRDWDWGSNAPGALLPPEEAVAIEVLTIPGEPIFIPKAVRDIYDGKYYATLLYASEDSLTFVYARKGNVVKGYTIHYVGLHTDPNLLSAFEESKGNELPGLTLDTPVGVASDKMLVAIRDNGKFLDARSKKDWWE